MALCCAAAVSCGKLFPDKVDVVQLGIVQDFVVASSEGESVGAKVISDRDYSLSVDGDSQWMSIEYSTRDTIVFSVEPNEGFCRSVYVSVSADGRTDKVQLRQEGRWKGLYGVRRGTRQHSGGFQSSVGLSEGFDSGHQVDNKSFSEGLYPQF